MRIESEGHKEARLCADECSRLRDELARSKADAAHVRGRLDKSRARVTELEDAVRYLQWGLDSVPAVITFEPLTKLLALVPGAPVGGGS